MLALTGGHEQTPGELCALLRRAGLAVRDEHSLGPRYAFAAVRR